MADNYIAGSFAFRCTTGEAALIETAWELADDLMRDEAPSEPDADILAAFPPDSPDDVWSGFRAIFIDMDYPSFGADMAVDSLPDDPGFCRVWIGSETDFQPTPIAALIHRCCPVTLADGPIGFEWAETCSRPRVDEFGGGWCAIFADRIDIESTGDALARALAGGP